MNSIEGILKLVDNEFEAINKNGKFRSREEIDSVYKLMDIVKDGMCIMGWEEDEYSDSSGPYRSYRGGYDDGMSMARGRGRGANRYTDGRYAPSSRRGVQYDGGYGGRSMNYSRADGDDEYKAQLIELMNTAPDEQTRQGIKRMLDNM